MGAAPQAAAYVPHPTPRVHPGAKPGGLGLPSGCPTIGWGRIPVWENIGTPVGRWRPPQCTGECPLARIPEEEEEEEEEGEARNRERTGGRWVGGGRAQVSGRRSTKVSWKPTAATLAPTHIHPAIDASKTTPCNSSTFGQLGEILATTMLSDVCVN